LFGLKELKVRGAPKEKERHRDKIVIIHLEGKARRETSFQKTKRGGGRKKREERPEKRLQTPTIVTQRNKKRGKTLTL